MKDTILITGAGPKGITGRLIKEYFQSRFNILTPASKELDLTNDNAVNDYFNHNKVDYVIHCATYRPSSTDPSHFVDEELESNLRMFLSLEQQSTKYKKMIYFGSGAEFDKSRPIVNVSEEDFGQQVPKNKYGLAKYIMNKQAVSSSNIYNLRLFGTINKYERFTKNIISNLCVKAMLGLPLQLRQNCRFSFIDINDILSIVENALFSDLEYHDYNMVMDKSYLLSDIAEIVKGIAGRNDNVVFEKEGLNLEYTGSNYRMKKTFSGVILSSIEESIENVYRHYEEQKNEINPSEIDARWR